MCDFDKVKSARLGTLIHNYRFLFRNGDIDSDFCDKCLDAMAKLAQAKTADEIDSVCKDVRYGDKHIAAIPLGNVLDLPLPAELIGKIRSIRKPSRLMFFLADTTKTQLLNEYKLTQQEFELVEAEANKIGYSFIDNEKSNI